MPSRNRPEMAEESIQSLGEGDFEVLIFLDDDDENILQYKDMAKKYKNVRIFVQPRETYYKFHKMINFLSAKAKGDWLLLWNDDAFMQGEWIHNLEKSNHEKIYVVRFGDSGNRLNLFPAISRKMYEVMGFYSMSPHCDSWVQDLSRDLGCELWFYDMQIEHRRDSHTLRDETKHHTMEAYKVTVPYHESEEVRAIYEKTLAKLKRAM